MGYLRVRNVGKAYKRYPSKWARLTEWITGLERHEKHWVLRDISFEVASGEAVGIIGVNGMGRGNLDNCARHGDVIVTAVCDVWEARRKPVLAEFPQAKEYADYRELLAD